MYRHTYQVVGSGQFPIDMLRYDGSYPESESQDSSAIHAALNRFHPVPPEVPAAVVAAFGCDDVLIFFV